MKIIKRKIFNIGILITSIATLVLILLVIFVKDDDKNFEINIDAFKKLYAYQVDFLNSPLANEKFTDRDTLEYKIDHAFNDTSMYCTIYKDAVKLYGTWSKDSLNFIRLKDIEIDSIFLDTLNSYSGKKLSYDEIVDLFLKNKGKNINLAFQDKHFDTILYKKVKSGNYKLNLGIAAFILLVLTILQLPLRYFLSENDISKANDAINKILEKSDADNTQLKPSWDTAQQTLELYYQRNLSQVTLIFNLSVIVMCMGFVLIIIGVLIGFFTDNKEFIGIVTASSGLITEFIGATFIFLYKSTIAQSLEYTKKLEKLSSVGVAIKILDTISSEKEYDPKQLIESKIEVAKKLLDMDKAKA